MTVILYPVENDTVPIPFATYGGTDGESITCSGLAVTDIEIYKDGSPTQRASDSGYTLLDTDGIDFDSLTGIHGFSIDLSDDTDAGFYEVGSWYWVVVSAITVDSQTVSFIAAMFRIQSATRGMSGTALPNAAADAAGGLPISDAGGLDMDALADPPPQLLQAATVGLVASPTQFTLSAGSADDDAYNGALIVMTDQNTAVQKQVAVVSDYVGSTKTITLVSDPGIFTLAAGDLVDIIAIGPGASAAGSAPTAAAIRAEIDANSTQLALIVEDTNEIQSDLEDDGRLDVMFDAILEDTNEMQGDLADDGRLDVIFDAIKLITDALGATAAARLALSAGQIIPFTVDTATNTHTPTTTEFQADDITEMTADHYNGRIIVWTSGVLAGQATSISDYQAVGGIGQFTVVGMTEAPANDDTGIIL
jgi:hypothetical protein